MKIEEGRFECRRDDLTIRGVCYRPSGSARNLPAVILSHGFMSGHFTVDAYARQLAECGYVTFCHDFCGGCTNGLSDGDTKQMSVLTEKEDLKAVISYVRTLDYVNPYRLILMGSSQGGFVSALAAAELKEEVTALVLFYPALCIPDDMREGRIQFTRFDPENIPDVIPFGSSELGRAYPEAAVHMDAFEEISPYKGPVLLVHGTNDEIVDVSYSKRAYEVYADEPGREAELVLIEGGAHGFAPDHAAAAMSAVKRFLERVLSGPEEKKTWCAIGDSFTYLNDHLEETMYRMEKGYVDRTAEKLPFPVQVINLGINGSTTEDWNTVPVKEADFYTILLGTNDWFHNTAPTGTPEDFTRGEPGTILGNLGLIVRHIRELGGKAKEAPVFIMNPVERGDFVYLLNADNGAHGSYEPEGGRRLKDLASDIYHGVSGDNIIPINLHDEAGFTQENAVHFKRTREGDLPYPEYIGKEWSLEETGHPYPPEAKWFTYDGLHPSPVGAEAIAQVLAQKIIAWYGESGRWS